MDVKVMLATGKLTSKNRLKKIPQVKETYDNLESKLFKERLNRIIEPQDKIDLRRKLEGFERFRVNQEDDREAEQRNDRLTEHRDQKERRDIELDKMRRVINFNKDWNERGEQTWKQIMEKQRGLEKEEKEAFMKRTTKMKARSMMKKEEFVLQVFDELDNFEKRHLEEKETDIETSQGDHLDGVGSGYDNNYLGISQNMSMRRQALEISQNHEELGKLIQVREKEMHSEFFRKERDKRRRKMIVDQSKGQKKLEITRKKHGLLDKMIQESRQEEEIRYEFWRTRKAKDLIVANRGLRDNMYANRGVYINQRENQREETILEHMIGDFKSQVDLYLKREKTLRINKDIDKRDGNYSKCRKIVDILLNIADSCYDHNQDTDAKDAEQIEPNFWDENLSLLKSSLSPFLYRNPRNKISTDIFTEEFDEKSKYSHFLDLELSQYLGARGQWRVKSIKDPKSHQQPVDSKDPLGESSRVKIPKAPVNNELLGNLVAKLIDQKFPEPEKQAKPEYPFYLPVKLCLIGKFYSGKSTVTRYLQNKFNLEIISVEEIVNQGIVRFGNCDDSFDHKEELDQHAFLQNGYASLLEDKPLDMLAEKNVDDEELLENKSFDRGLGDEAVSQHIQLGGGGGEPNPSEFIPETEEGVEEGQHGDEEELARSVVQHEKPATEKLVRNPVKSLIRKLFRGQEPSDEDYALIIIDEIKRRHPFMTEEEFYRMMTDRRTSLVRQEKDRMIKEQEQTNEKVNLTRQKVDMNEKRKNIQIDEEQFTLVPPSGYVLLDFPNSYKQANVLENLMSRFLCRDKAVKTHAQIEKEFLLKLIKPSEKALPPKSLKESGFDMVMYMEASNSECLNRAFGDYQTSRNMHYHLVANPPPTNKTPLVETLQFNENQQKNQYLMADLNKNRSIDLPRVVAMYDHFGTNQDGIKTIRIVDANQDMTSLLADIDEIVSGIMQKKNEYYSSFASMLENSRKESERKQAENEEKAKKEAQMKLADPADLHSALLKSKEMMTKDPLRSDILDLLLNLWNLSSKSYVSKAQEVFTDIRACREIISVVIAEYQRAFIQYMETDDEKKQWLYEFQAMYNGFIDQNPDLLEQESVKEEFHQR